MKRILIIKIIASIIYFIVMFIIYMKYSNQIFNNAFKLV
jgi:amino acid permease